MNIVLKLTMAILIVSLFITLIRVVRGPGLYNRVVALDLITSESAGIILIFAILSKNQVFIDVAVIIFMISFLGTVAISKYLSKSDQDE